MCYRTNNNRSNCWGDLAASPEKDNCDVDGEPLSWKEQLYQLVGYYIHGLQLYTQISARLRKHVFILQVCGGAYTKDRGRYRDAGLQLCYQWAKEGIAHRKHGPPIHFFLLKFCVFGDEIGITDINAFHLLMYNNCCVGFREMQRSISIRTSNHCKTLKVCC